MKVKAYVITYNVEYEKSVDRRTGLADNTIPMHVKEEFEGIVQGYVNTKNNVHGKEMVMAIVLNSATKKFVNVPVEQMEGLE